MHALVLLMNYTNTLGSIEGLFYWVLVWCWQMMAVNREVPLRFQHPPYMLLTSDGCTNCGLMKENPANSAWSMFAITSSSGGVSWGWVRVKNLSKFSAPLPHCGKDRSRGDIFRHEVTVTEVDQETGTICSRSVQTVCKPPFCEGQYRAVLQGLLSLQSADFCL